MSRYINVFNKQSDVSTAVTNGSLSPKYIAYVLSGDYVNFNGRYKYTPSEEEIYASQYMTIEMLEPGVITAYELYGSTDNGASWTKIGDGMTTGISAQAGDKILLKAVNPFFSHEGSPLFSTYVDDSYEVQAKFNVYGNYLSIIYGDNFVNFSGDTIPNADYQAEGGCFLDMPVVSAEHLILPNVDQSKSNFSFYSMFSGCTELTTAPKVRALGTRRYSFGSMFRDCTKLNSVTIECSDFSGSYCTNNMLSGCAATGTIYIPAGATFPSNDIPSGWTVQTIA